MVTVILRAALWLGHAGTWFFAVTLFGPDPSKSWLNPPLVGISFCYQRMWHNSVCIGRYRKLNVSYIGSIKIWNSVCLITWTKYFQIWCQNKINGIEFFLVKMNMHLFPAAPRIILLLIVKYCSSNLMNVFFSRSVMPSILLLLYWLQWQVFFPFDANTF